MVCFGAERLGEGRKLVIGLNPPFGKNNTLANQFVRHAARFRPRLIVLIVPPATLVPEGYDVVFEDSEMCGGKKFFVPGAPPPRGGQWLGLCACTAALKTLHRCGAAPS